jgi:hypothetical protein
MDGDKQRADRFLNIALRAIREGAQAGDGVARYAEAVLRGERSGGHCQLNPLRRV